MSKKRSAKGQFVKSGAGKRATKATAIALPPRKRRRARRNPDSSSGGFLAPQANPPELSELAEFILPGFAGFAGTKLLARIVATQAAKRWPNAGKHLAVGSTVVSFLAAWFLLHRIKRLAKYQMPATVGAGIAALQSAVAAWFPKYGWMVSDIQPEPSRLTGVSPLLTASAPETLFPGGPEVVDDDASIEDIDLGSLTGGSLGGGGDEDALADMN